MPDLAFGFGDCPLGVCENADEENDAEIAVLKKIIDMIRATLIFIEGPPHIFASAVGPALRVRFYRNSAGCQQSNVDVDSLL